jgi:uncharacterized protein YdeI (YjbR/CyaY-like superfamily)
VKVAEGSRLVEENSARCGLSEEMKWGKPCFTHDRKNVAIVIPLKDACAISFFKGAPVDDPKHILQKIGEHTQAGRWIKFTLFQRNRGHAVDSAELHPRSHRGREVGQEGYPQEGFRVCGS